MLGCMQAAVERRGCMRRRIAVVFDERVWRLERHTEGEDWWQRVLRHRESGMAVEVVNVHLPHRQYDLQAYVKPLVEVGQPRVRWAATSTRTFGTATERRAALASFLAHWGMSDVQPKIPAEWTHEQWGIRRRLDYILRHGMRALTSCVARHVANRSDHTPTVMRASMQCTARTCKRETHRVAVGWRPHACEAYADDAHASCFGPDSSSRRVEGAGVGQRSGAGESNRP